MRIKCQKTFLVGALAVGLASLQAQAALTHRYTFDSSAQDSVGTAHATLKNGAALEGGSVYLNYQVTSTKASSDPTGDYVDFPTNLLSGYTNVTIDFWFQGGSPTAPAVPTWSRLFDFGSSANNNGVNYMFYTAHSGSTDHRFVVQSGVGEQTVLQAGALEGASAYHVTAVFDFTSHYMELYKNGVQVARNAINTNANPTNINYQNVWIGCSQYGGDTYFIGSVDEFRIYNSSLSAPEIMASELAGPSSTSGSISSLGTVAGVSFLQGGTNQTAISLMERANANVAPAASFDNAGTVISNIPLFRLAGVSLTSSDPTIASVTPEGAIKGLKPGAVTLTATYGGKVATLSVTVTNDPVVPTVNSVNNNGYNRLFDVIFSKEVSTNSAQTLSNYTIDNGAIKVQSATLLANNTVRLYTDVFDTAASHNVTVAGVQDLAFTPNTVESTNFVVGPPANVPANGMTWKIWTNINNFGNWKASARFPNGPDATSFITNAETFSPTGTNNYATVWQAYFVPTNTGNYWFAIATDDEGELFISTNDNPSFVSSSPISSVGTWVGNRSFANQLSKAPIAMEAGKKYYMQLNFHQAGGGDNAAIACNTTNSIPNNSLPIPGEMLIPYIGTPIPMTIVTQPTNQSLFQGQDASFSVFVSAVPAATSYQWYRNNQVITNATKATYSLPLIQQSNDNNAVFYCVVSNLVDCVTSAPATLTITIDPIPPTVAKVNGSATMDKVYITYSKRMDAATAGNKANYSITGNGTTLAINSVSLDNTLSNLVITTAKQTSKVLYTVTLKDAIVDLARNKISSTTGLKYTFNGFDAAPGYTYVRFYDGYTGGPDNLYAYSLTNTPTRTRAYNDFGTLNHSDSTYQNFGGIAEGYIIAPEDGAYGFALAADDTARFYLGTNDMPSSVPVAYICSVTGWTAYDNFGADPGPQRLSPYPNGVQLLAGQRYFYRVCWQQNAGGGGFHVIWSKPSDYYAWSTIPGTNYAASGDPSGATVQITKQPVSLTVGQGNRATFSIAATGFSLMGTNVTYQWQRNGTNIAGATGTNYVIGVADMVDNNSTFACVVGLPFASVKSDTVTLTVTPDLVKPTVVSAGAFLGSTQIGIRFSKPVIPTTVSLGYTIDGGTYGVPSVAFRTNSLLDGVNGDMVVLTLDGAVTEGLTVTVSAGLTDRWGNVSTAPVTVPVEICNMTAQDIGTATIDPLFVGSTVPTSAKSFQLIGGGSDIWLGTDACQFVYMPYSGNFDARARVANISQSDVWAKVGIMVRSSLDGNGTMAFDAVTPPTGQNAYAAHYRTGVNSNAVDFAGTRPGNLQYPNAWVRVTRRGESFAVWSSVDGVSWVQHGQADLTAAGFPQDVYVGVAATAHNNTSATASFTVSDVYDFSVGPLADPQPVTINYSYSNGNLVISWDAVKGDGLVLQWSGDLNGGWTTSGNAPTISNGIASRTISTVDAVRFYRLISQ